MNQNKIYNEIWREVEEGDPRPFLEFKTKLIKDYLENKNGVALDIGCGDGFFTLKLLKFGYKVDSIDGSMEAIKSTKHRVQRIGKLNSVRLLNEDFLKFEPGTKYDIILCLEVLEHIKDDFAALEKINKLLKDNGILILSVPHRKDLWNYSDEIGGHYRRYSKQDLLSKLEEKNFTIERIFDYGFPFTRAFVHGFCIPSAKKKSSNVGPPKNTLLNRIASKFISGMCLIDKIFINNNKGINLIAIAKKP